MSPRPSPSRRTVASSCRSACAWRGAATAAIVAALALPAPAAAKDPSEITAVDRETARNLLDQGDQLFEAGDHAGALQKYQAADAIMGVPTTAIEVGRALEALGRLVEARDAFLRVLRYPRQESEPSAFAKARTRADERARELAARIPKLTVVIEGDATDAPVVRIDGRVISAALVGQPLSVDPGERRVQIEAPGMLPADRTVALAEGQSEEIVLRLTVDPDALPLDPSPGPEPAAPADPAPPSPGGVPIFATIGFSIGAAGLVVGAVTGGLSLAKTASLDETCGGDAICPIEAQGAIDEAELFANVSNVGFAVAGAGVLFGVIALFTLDADAPAESALVPLVGPGSLGLRGRF